MSGPTRLRILAIIAVIITFRLTAHAFHSLIPFWSANIPKSESLIVCAREEASICQSFILKDRE
jgi:hypothetical protein